MTDAAETTETVEVIRSENGGPGRPGAYRHINVKTGKIEVYLGVTQAAALLGIERKTLIALQRNHPTELPIYEVRNSRHCYKREDLIKAREKYLSGPVLAGK